MIDTARSDLSGAFGFEYDTAIHEADAGAMRRVV